jgi:putative radical SAM enzyme (TIGR03279 family)
MRIIAVKNKGLGHRAGLRPGFDLLSINGRSISDSIDLRFHESDERLDLYYKDRSGKINRSLIEKDYDDPLGVVLEEPKFHSCGNKCIFCFVDQMPRGMRQALYFKDEDYRLSFLHGNYITLSNISRSDLDRIKQQRLSPLYISVHATGVGLRQRMLGGRRVDEILRIMKDLVAGGIELHTQIVLCPGINDGRHLKKSLSDLVKLYPGVKSIAVVPVGLTKHRQKLFPLSAINKEYSRHLIGEYRGWQKQLRHKFKKTILYFADEFYLNAGLDIPISMWYDDFPQLDNGVGMVREFWNRFAELTDILPARLACSKKVLFITGTSGLKVLRPVVARLNRVKGLKGEVLLVKNTLFGDTVTVSGLLSGRDILSSLKAGKNDHNLIVLPENLLNHEGKFIDDLSLGEFKRRLRPAKVVVGLEGLIKTI